MKSIKPAVFVRDPALLRGQRVEGLLRALEEGGCPVVKVTSRRELEAAGADLLLAVGGDGTFLSAAALVADSGIPVLGVNAGRLGFLSENAPEAVAHALLNSELTIEDTKILGIEGLDTDLWPFAVNEVTVHRSGAAMLGVDVTIDGRLLPTYWADGLLVATSSGSTAYSLSIGGPIVLPGSQVLIVSPIAPHNLNVRPMIVPDNVTVELKFHSRDDRVTLSMDNRSVDILPNSHLTVRVAQFSLKRVRLNASDFINALTEKLFWGEDIRNGREHLK